MRKFIFAVLMSNVIFSAQSQPMQAPVKYKDFVFAEVMIKKNEIYRDGKARGIKNKYCRYDWYEPVGDTSKARPLIIWLHGGGFKFGKKTSGGLPLWAKTFAQRGYVCAAINYRLSKKHPLRNYADLVEGCSMAIDDLNDAIEFFKANANSFKIDTQHIITGGNSAGGMIALQAVYSSKADLKKLVDSNATHTPGTYNPQKICAVINFWGAMFTTNWMHNTKVPVVSVHGKKDRVVPFNSRQAGIYGSETIHETADSLGIPNRLKLYDGYAHELQKHFNPLFAGNSAKKRWREAGDFVALFLYDVLFRKNE